VGNAIQQEELAVIKAISHFMKSSWLHWLMSILLILGNFSLFLVSHILH